MAEVALFRGPTNLASPASRASSSSSSLRYLATADGDVLPRRSSSDSPGSTGSLGIQERREEEGEESEEEERWSFLALLLALLRKSLLGCTAEGGGGGGEGMEIGWPTDVQHVAHVTFDRFHGFLGLPVEFEPEVPRRAPSARKTADTIREVKYSIGSARSLVLRNLKRIDKTVVYPVSTLWKKGNLVSSKEDKVSQTPTDSLQTEELLVEYQ